MILLDKPRLLVAVARYHDTDKSYGLGFVRPRNRFYKKCGFAVTVLDFSAEVDTVLEDIPIITYSTYENSMSEFDILVMHAPNIRNHYRFLRKFGDRFSGIVLFVHGHEMMRVKHSYAKPFPFVRAKGLRERFESAIRDPYDLFKLRVWRRYFEKEGESIQFVFVSEWMRDEFLKWVKVSPSVIEGREHIIPNCVGEDFEKGFYSPKMIPEYDFVTIRGNIDGSKYCVDLVNDFAKQNPDKKFLVVGQGELFCHIEKAPNLVHMAAYLSHDEMIDVLNNARCALMPTRTDAQGVAMCEIATLGMPLITSDIPVCHESLDGFSNVAFVPNDERGGEILAERAASLNRLVGKKNPRYFLENTAQKEIDLYMSLFNSARGDI